MKYKTYAAMQHQQQKEYNGFTKGKVFFAFSKEQFAEGMKSVGLATDDTDKIYSIGNGGYILRSQSKAHAEFIDKLNKEKEEHLKDFSFMKSAFRYELANHEYCITYEFDETLDALELTFEQVNTNPMLKKALLEARNEYLAKCEEW